MASQGRPEPAPSQLYGREEALGQKPLELAAGSARDTEGRNYERALGPERPPTQTAIFVWRQMRKRAQPLRDATAELL